MHDRESRYQFGQTRWSLVLAAGKQAGDTAAAARHDLLIRYHEAVYRYLCARLNDTHAAGELFSRFAERVLEVHPFLERANREKGRFRDYLRSVLQRMVIDYYRERQRSQKHRRELTPDSDVEPAAPETDEADEEFRKVWAEELMHQAWKGLEQVELEGGHPYYSLLFYKAQNSKVRSEAMAQHFSQKLGRALTAANVRQLIHRGQEMLNDLLVAEVARTLRQKQGDVVTVAQIEEELGQLQFLDKSRREALARFRA